MQPTNFFFPTYFDETQRSNKEECFSIANDTEYDDASLISQDICPSKVLSAAELFPEYLTQLGHFDNSPLSMIPTTNNQTVKNFQITSPHMLKKRISSSFKGFDHATWYVSNAKQAASYFVYCLGFEWVAYKGLETGSKVVSAHVVQNGDVMFEFVSPILSSSEKPNEAEFLDKIHSFIRRHGDGVKDVAFRVDDVKSVYENAIQCGAKSAKPPSEYQDEYGVIKLATIEVFDDVYHTLINRDHYSGIFMPGYVPVKGNSLYEPREALCLQTLPPVTFEKIDHCVQNEDWDQLESACATYSKIFGFHRFWSVDEKQVSTHFSALRSIVMSSENEEVKMPINEPAKGICKSQIEEFIEFYNGAGVQHIALLTNDIITTVANMKQRGAQFIAVPSLYYDTLFTRLSKMGITINEDFEELRKLGILVDFDENGYLLQLFTKPLGDRPTFFLEVIQRNNHNGFGAGNFKALFETIESEQRLRGTLERN